MDFFWIILSSFTASAYGALVGFGGGVFIIPILVLVFGYPIQYAVGAVVFSLIPSSLITTLLNNKERHVDYATGSILELPTMIGVVIGSSLVAILPKTQLEYVFVIAISAVGFSFFRRKGKNLNQNSFWQRLNAHQPAFIKKDSSGRNLYRVNYLLAASFGLLSGCLAGLLGVGGGFLKTPIMIKIFKIPVKIAAGTALFMILITSVTSTVSHYWLGHILWPYTFPVIIGFVTGPFVAYKAKKHLSSLHLEKLVGISLILAALIMLFNILSKA